MTGSGLSVLVTTKLALFVTVVSNVLDVKGPVGAVGLVAVAVL